MKLLCVRIAYHFKYVNKFPSKALHVYTKAFKYLLNQVNFFFFLETSIYLVLNALMFPKHGKSFNDVIKILDTVIMGKLAFFKFSLGESYGFGTYVHFP